MEGSQNEQLTARARPAQGPGVALGLPGRAGGWSVGRLGLSPQPVMAATCWMAGRRELDEAVLGKPGPQEAREANREEKRGGATVTARLG
ncbi:hypothetical protein NL676_008265 [Syzygium grande]|nr:hypothetical protein NL676_008265 [Syzygium grande]